MSVRTLSRRDFLKTAGIALGGGIAACGGLTALATYTPSVKLPASTLGDQTMSKKILIAYASKCGSTGEVATAIGRTLAQNNVYVDVLPIKQVADLAGYEVVFVGSAIRAGRWLREATDFVSGNRTVLQGVPTAYFTVCMTMAEDTPDNRAKAAGFIEPVRAVLTPAAEGYFAGKVDPARLSFVENAMLNAKHVPQGDFRDWNKIRDWAQSIYSEICA